MTCEECCCECGRYDQNEQQWVPCPSCQRRMRREHPGEVAKVEAAIREAEQRAEEVSDG